MPSQPVTLPGNVSRECRSIRAVRISRHIRAAETALENGEVVLVDIAITIDVRSGKLLRRTTRWRARDAGSQPRE